MGERGSSKKQQQQQQAQQTRHCKANNATEITNSCTLLLHD